jgi:hypothetical protein
MYHHMREIFGKIGRIKWYVEGHEMCQYTKALQCFISFR